MSGFNPAGNEEVLLKGRTFRVQAHRSRVLVADKAAVRPGARAKVYHLTELSTGEAFALKVMHDPRGEPDLLRNRSILSQLAKVPGFEACGQQDFTPATDAVDLSRYPCLENASIMPWVKGQTWATFMGADDPNFDAETSWKLAYELAVIMSVLERNRIAHCDLSGSNVLVRPRAGKVTLIDFDDLYWETSPPLQIEPTGTPGYRQRDEVQWNLYGDRFASAILIAEMLGWRDPRVHAARSGDSYFSEADFTADNSRRYALLHNLLCQLHPELGQLFEQAWLAPLSQCPPVFSWRPALLKAQGRDLVPLDERDRVKLTLPIVQPAAQSRPATPRRTNQQQTPVPPWSPSPTPKPINTSSPDPTHTPTRPTAPSPARVSDEVVGYIVGLVVLLIIVGLAVIFLSN